jgi:hypothetical protein
MATVKKTTTPKPLDEGIKIPAGAIQDHSAKQGNDDKKSKSPQRILIVAAVIAIPYFIWRVLTGRGKRAKND